MMRLAPLIAAGALCGLAVGAAIAFFQLFAFSFTWIIPCALIVGIGVGALVSLVPMPAGTRKIPVAVEAEPNGERQENIVL